MSFPKDFLKELPEGGNGRRLCDESFLVLFFFGIPGNCSHENGMPKYRSGVAGTEESSRKKDIDPSDDEEVEERDGLRR